MLNSAFYGQHLHNPQPQPERDRIAAKLRYHLGWSITCYRVRFEVWHSVIWVSAPGYSPRFVSLSVIGK